MNVQEMRKVYEEDLKKMEQLKAEALELKAEMERAEIAFDEKLRELRKAGLLPTESYIVTGEEEEGALQQMAEFEEYQEDIYAGKEKEAYREARGNYSEKLIQIINFESELTLAEHALEQAEENSEPGDDA